MSLLVLVSHDALQFEKQQVAQKPRYLIDNA